MRRHVKLSWMVVVVSFLASYWGTDTLPAEAAASASITGKVTLSGAAPAQQKIKMAADPVCMQQHPQAVMSQEIVANNGALQYALVYVKDGVQGSFPPPAQAVTIDQAGCMYTPHVFGIQVGQKLEVINSDSTLHNINCQAKLNKKFNLAQPTKGMKTSKTFDQPEVGVPFKCNVHPWMTAYAGVFTHPFFAVTDASGSFQIAGLPAGTYTVEVWQEKLGTQSQKVTVADGEKKAISFTLAAK